jgi:dTDP-4-dehydrorhamnose reductase
VEAAMLKVMVFGARGMFGHVAVRFLEGCRKKYKVIPCARDSNEKGTILVDVKHYDRVRDIIQEHQPNIVVNAIGLLIKDCSQFPAEAVLVNSFFPHYLAKLASILNFKLIHISTDCVFSGKKGNYSEKDFCDGESFYARTKALGEIDDKNNLTIRTSIIGPELKKDGSGLFQWFMQQSGTINGYTQAFWSGVTTLELAKFLDFSIQNDLRGLFQLSMTPKISKYDLLKIISNIFNKKDVVIMPCSSFYCDKSLIPTQSNPVYSLPNSYQDMISQLYTMMRNNLDLYKSFF